MNERASAVGELAARILAKGGRGEVTRVFPSSVYIKSGDDFVVLLWGNLRSPLTVNIAGERRDSGMVPGGRCRLGERGVSLDDTMVETEGAAVYRGKLRRAGQISLPRESELVSSVVSLRSLYDISPGGLKLPADPAFRDFVDSVALPLARGDREAVRDFSRFRPLIGRGIGFTPAGDDLVGGFVAVFNYFARARRWQRVSLPMKLVVSLTIPESAAILRYAAEGYVDELMARLILKSTASGRGSFHRELLSVARRGHTSGIDMALGAILCESALKDAEQGGEALGHCLDALWNA